MCKKILVTLTIFAAVPFLAFAQATVTVNPNLPGQTSAPSDIGGWVNSFYGFALMIGGILAFGAIVYGGVKYVLAAANPSQAQDAKGWITQALLGLILLLGAYVILNVINPNLVTLSLPTLEKISGVPLTPTGAGGSAGGATCQAPASGPCSAGSLMSNGGGCFGSNTNTAAGVCAVETSNGALLSSTVDKCADGSPVSFGLFQINISANNLPGLPCRSAFDAPFSGSHPTCNITNRTLYEQCKTAALTATVNIAEACALSSNGATWSQWGPNTRQSCGL